jgi:hypothetical protein
MADVIERWGKAIHRRYQNWDSGELMKEPMCIGNVSKILKGSIGSDHIFQKCEDPECAVEKQSIGLFDCVLESYKCESEWSRKNIYGKLAGSIVAMYNGNNEKRGLHTGKFTLTEPNNDRVIVEGTLVGICNAGTHHEPVKDCEKCDQKDRWLGQIRGVIRPKKSGDIPCVMLAEYAFDVKYKNRERNAATIIGTLEGVHVCECKKPAD